MLGETRAVVFDLADVLFDFRGQDSLARLTAGRIGPVEFSRLWSSPLADALYVGNCTPDDFAASVVAEFALAISPVVFLREFASWFRGPFPGALGLVEEVRNKAIVACLSNTNPIDVARFRTEVDIDRRFDRCFFSNETGLRKPDHRCYEYVLEQLGLSSYPSHVVLLDDSEVNVEAARRAGLEAYQVRGIAEVQECLSSIGLLSASVRPAPSKC